MNSPITYSFDSESTNNSSAEIDTILEQFTKKEHKYNVVLLDDDDHTYDYVIEMLMHVFGHSIEEKAAMKKDEILNFGPDHRLARSKGSMNAIIEPAGKK